MLSRIRNRTLHIYHRNLGQLDTLPLLAILGVITGIVTGAIILLFRAAIELPLQHFLPNGDDEGFESLSMLARALLPLSGALVIGIYLHRLSAPNRRMGIGHVIERLNYHQGHLGKRGFVHQFVIGALTLISGQSAGREGPAVHLGAAGSSLIGQWLRLPNNSIRTLVACGTAAAVSASFNTPIAGVIFAMEVVMLEYTISGFTPVILAAVSGAVVSQLVYGDVPAFSVPPYALQSLLELPYIVLMGLVFAICSATFVRLQTYFMRFASKPVLPRVLLAGALTGAVAMFFPQIMGVGYDTVSAAIDGELGFALLVMIGLAKLLVTPVATGLGMPNGIIAPTVMVGAVFGAAMGILGQMLAPSLASPVGLYALLGMGAMMGAVLQAPLAALMAVIELTRSTQIILPAMLVIVVSSLASAHFFRQRSLFTTVLQIQGLDHHSTPLSQALRRVSVSSMMERKFQCTGPQLPPEHARELLRTSPKWIVVERADGPMFLLAAADLARYLEDLAASETIEPLVDGLVDLCEIPAERLDLAPLHLQATLEEALLELEHTGVEALYVQRMTAPPGQSIVGIITRANIESYYQLQRR